MSNIVVDSHITEIHASAPQPQPSHSPAAEIRPGLSFGSILSALNPLQLIPVVGSIYRAVTGDEGDPDVRFFGSLAVSGLTGGPIGLGINLLEKITGFDPEAIVLRLFGIHPHTFTASAPVQHGPTNPVTSGPLSAATAWTAAQLRAYGVQMRPDGTLSKSNAVGADVLNTLELERLSVNA